MSYVYDTFDEATDEATWARMAARLVQRAPQFYAIDDNLHAPSEDTIAFHRAKIEALLARLAPHAEAWERDATGAAAGSGLP
jgi:hypothetical protein